MITKLSGEAEADAIENARCNEEMGKTEAKKADLESTVWGSTSKNTRAASRNAGEAREVDPSLTFWRCSSPMSLIICQRMNLRWLMRNFGKRRLYAGQQDEQEHQRAGRDFRAMARTSSPRSRA